MNAHAQHQLDIVDDASETTESKGGTFSLVIMVSAIMFASLVMALSIVAAAHTIQA